MCMTKKNNDSQETLEKTLPYSLTNDYLFRALLQRNNTALRGLLSALLDINQEDILSCEIQNPIILGEALHDKNCILDIRILLNSNRLINLEMQVGNLEYWEDRSLYYLSKIFTNLKAGDGYEKVKPCVHIGIMSKLPFEDTDFFYG